MKYAHALTKQLSKYDPYINKLCLQYKPWKKLIKYSPEYTLINWKKNIINECKNVDNLLYCNKCKCFLNKKLDNNIIEHLCFINVNTLYKICKKLQKKLNINALEYLDEIIKTRKFKFTQIAYQTIIDDYL